MITKIFLDMDGVLADFVTGIEGPKYLNATLSGSNVYDNNKQMFANKRLFRNLPPMPDMYELVHYVKKTGIYWELLSCAGEIARDIIVSDKIAWTKRYVDNNVVVTCTLKGKHKAAFASPDHILVDDREKNIEAWENAGGIGILHTNSADTIVEIENIIKPKAV